MILLVSGGCGLRPKFFYFFGFRIMMLAGNSF
jgi:hypothetical protein